MPSASRRPTRYCFVVVDADTDDLAPFERDAVMITTAGVVSDVFHSGETIIRHRGRVIVLASKSESTRDWAAALTQALREAPITRSADPTVWADELPASTHRPRPPSARNWSADCPAQLCTHTVMRSGIRF